MINVYVSISKHEILNKKLREKNPFSSYIIRHNNIYMYMKSLVNKVFVI